MAGAPRLLLRLWSRAARGALRAACLLLPFMGTAGHAETIISARFTEPTERYAHGVLGDAVEWGALEITTSASTPSGAATKAVQKTNTYTFKLPLDHVFEDVEPRLADLDGDGAPEVLVVETDVTAGGAFAIYGVRGKITETPHIGTRNRWLAPLGAADLDGDGIVEIAYIDRPHLAKTLRIWRYDKRMLTEVAAIRGFTNHRIGEADIAGGIRDCGAGPHMVLATANWSDLTTVRWDGDVFAVDYIGSDTSRPAFARAMACK